MNAPPSVPSHRAGDARRWKPTPLIAGAAALHAGAAAAVIAQPAAWPWAVGGVVASHLALTAAGLWPRSALLGPNWTRLPTGAGRRIALTIDDGPDPDVTPRMLDLLDRYDARATFFCIGDLARRHPRWIEAIVARGHAVENHSQRHRHTFSLSGPAALRREISAAQRTLTEIAGTPPAVLPRAGRPAQSVSRTGAVRTRPAARQLDATRFRHAHPRCRDRHTAPAARARCARHPAGARRSRGTRCARRTGRARSAAGGTARRRRCAVALDHAARGARA